MQLNTVNATPTVTVPGGMTETLMRLQAAIRDMRRANRPAAGEDYVARVADRVDAAYTLPVETVEEAEAMLRLVLESDGETFDPMVRRAIMKVSWILIAAAAP